MLADVRPGADRHARRRLKRASVVATCAAVEDHAVAFEPGTDSHPRRASSAEMEEPVLAKWSDTDQPILSIAIASNVLDGPELTRLVDPDITREIKSVSGVADVRLAGSIERELTVELRPQALQASGVSIGQVVSALAAPR